MNKYELKIRVCGNIDHGEDPNNAPFGMKREYSTVSDNIPELQIYVRDFVDEYDLGAGNVESAKVYESGEYIGDIFYNGNWKSKEELKWKM